MVETTTTRTVLGLVVAGTSLAIVRVGFVPMAVPQPPAAKAAMAEQLKQQGWLPTAFLEARQGQKVSQAKAQVFTLQNSNPAVQLKVIPVRVRGAATFDVATIRDNILNNSSDGAAPLKRAGDVVLITKPQQGKRSLLTCIVRGGAATDSERLVNLRLSNDPANTNLDRLRMLAGLQQPREWGCLFTEISVNSSSSAQSQLIQAWDAVKTTLKQGV